MPDQEQVIEQPRNQMVISGDQLIGKMFGIETTEQPKQEVPKTEQQQIQVAEPKKEEPTKTETAKPEEQEEILDTNEWLKREFNWENEDIAKAEINELRKLKEVKPEYKFENEDSKRLAEAIAKGNRKEVLSILEKQDKIESYLTSEINKSNAEDIIKLSMQLKYPSLTKDQIDFQFRQDYAIPKEPVMKDIDDEAEFKEKHDAWKEQVSNIEMKKTIAATMAKPELEQAKTKLILPEIQTLPVQKQLTQEELDAAKKFEEAFNQSVESAIKSFNGVSVAVKNEVVDFPVTFDSTNEEKTAIATTLKEFAKSGYDANWLLADLWVKDDGTINTDKMIKDYHLLKNSEKAIQKIANDSANKAIEAYIKGKKNININETFQQGTVSITNSDKTSLDEIRDKIFG